jgi:two-component system sensor histidine kinase ChvG
LIRRFKDFAKRHWPVLSLRTILFGTLLFVATLPGFAAMFLRVYENTLVQQTEAELIAEGAMLEAAYKALWREGAPDPAPRRLAPEPPRIDLRTMPVRGPQPEPVPAGPPDPHAERVARTVAPIVADASSVTLAATRLLDRQGIVVLGTDDRGRSYANLPEIRAALAGRRVTLLRERGNYQPRYLLEMLSRAASIRVHHVRPVVDSGRVIGIVMLSRSPRGLFFGIYQDRGKIALGAGLILLVLIVLAGLLSRGIARPIDALSEATQDVARGLVHVPDPPVTAAREIRALFENFAIMAERIEQRSRYLRDFAAAVSHEFKTPIAGIRGALELLDEHGAAMSKAERRRFIANAAADAERLSRLVQRLLDLARADMTTIAADSRADVGERIAALADAFRNPGFAIEVAAPAKALPPARITPEVLDTVIETLIDNSRRAGAGRVDIGLRRSAAGIEVAVSDDGGGIAEADRARIFEPFFTGRRESGGTGLGLSIARSLLAATGGSIVSEPVETGALFTLWLPEASTS